MGKSICKAGSLVYFQQHIGDPYIGQTSVEIEDKLICFFRNVSSQTVKFQDAVFNGTTRNGTGFGSSSQTFQPIGHARLAVIQPFLWVKRNSQPGLTCATP